MSHAVGAAPTATVEAREQHPKVVASRTRRPKNLWRARYCEGVCNDGTPCTHLARRGRPFCREHGGNNRAGINHPNFKHGLDSKYSLLPGALATAYENARNNPDLLELTEHIALLDARLKTLVRDLSTVWNAAGLDEGSNPRPDWLRLRDAWDAVMSARDQRERAIAVARMGALVSAGASSVEMTTEYAAMTEQLRRLVETQTRRDEKLGQFVPVDQVRALAQGMAAVVKRNVTDPGVIEKIRLELAALFHHRPSMCPKLAIRPQM